MKVKRYFTGLCAITGLEALIALIWLLSLPADPKNAVLWGYSTSRLVMAGGMIFAVLVFIIAGVYIWKHDERICRGLNWLEGKQNYRWGVCSILFVVSIVVWALAWMPDYRFGAQILIYERLEPIIFWVGLTCCQFLLALLIWQDVLSLKKIWKCVQLEEKLWLFGVCGVSLFFFLVNYTNKSGSTSGIELQQYNPPGSPLLTLQVQAGWIIGLIALILFNVIFHHKKSADYKFPWTKLDLGVFILIWIIVAVVWIKTPVKPTFFAPGPYPPDGDFFPYSDAALYDTTAQFAMMGLGLRNGGYVDKPLYSSFITVLHAFGGQDYWLITGIQTAVFAVLASLAYGIGRHLHGRPAGIVAASLIMFRGVNSIAGGHWIQTAHSRLFLSEMPTAVLLGGLIYTLVRWVEHPESRLHPLLAGGVLGSLTLIRHNPWLLVPVIVVLAFILYWRKWKQWVIQVSLFGVAMMVIIAPWMYYSQKTVGTPWYFMIPIRGSIWQNRLLPALEGESLVPEVKDEIRAIVVPQATGSLLLSGVDVVSEEMMQAGTGSIGVLRKMTAYTLNNIRGSLLILPDTLIADDLDHTLSVVGSVWQGNWGDRLSALTALNVFVMFVGVGVSWKKFRLAGLVPLVIYAGYLLSISVVFTSGGRYLVPIDWIILLYYSVGVVQFLAWVLGINLNEQNEISWRQRGNPVWQWIAGIAGLVLLIGMIPYAQESIPLNVFSQDVETLPSGEWMDNAELRPDVIEGFLTQDDALVQSGRVIYPRFYNSGQGETEDCYSVRPYPRLVFQLLNSEGAHCIVLPLANMSYNVQLHASNAVVLRCDEETAFAVLFPDLDYALLRNPYDESMTCPLPDPVCFDNRNCQ